MNSNIYNNVIDKVSKWKKEYLERLESVFDKLLDVLRYEEKFGKELIPCWDWDLIQAYIEDYSNKSMYTGLLQNTLEYLDNESRKIIILDGTIDDMKRYLLKKGDMLRKARIISETSDINEKLKLAKDIRRQDWITMLNSYQNITKSRSITRLNDFISEKTELLYEVLDEDDAISDIELKSSDEYQDAYESIDKVRSGRNRNIADAKNISQLQIVRKKGQNLKLITGTKVILENYPNIALDPYFSLVAYYIRDAYSTLDSRIRALRLWRNKISDLIMDSNMVEQTLKGTDKQINKTHLLQLIKSIGIFKNDEVLSNLILIIDRATNFNRQRSELTKITNQEDFFALLEKIPATELRRYERQISEFIHKLYRIKRFDIKMKNISKSKVINKYQILNENNKPSINVEFNKTCYSIAWPVFLTLNSFLLTVIEILNNKWVPNPKSIIIERLVDGPYIDEIKIEYKNKRYLVSEIKKLKENDRLIRVRITTNTTQIFYEPGDVYLNRDSIVAVVCVENKYAWFKELYRETSINYFPENILTSKLKEIINLDTN